MVSQEAGDAAASAVARAGWQGTVFAAEPSRLAVLSLKPAWPLSPLRIAIHRNSGVEIFSAPLSRFLAFAGYLAEYDIGDFDDSLSFGTGGPDATIDLVWLDAARYSLSPTDLVDWLVERLTVRRHAHAHPILVGILASDSETGADIESALIAATHGLGGIVVCDVSRTAGILGPSFYSERTGAVTASPLSNRAALLLARLLGLEWLPAALLPRIKAIAVDLDGTLYEGVLGEDGPLGLVVAHGHTAVQASLHAYAQSGVLLVLTSKNAAADVEDLFARRTDFTLQLSDFADLQIGWVEKAASIERAAERLRIAPDAFLLVDDNLGEIAATSAAISGLRTLFAADPLETSRALSLYPGLVGYPASEADAVRAKDLATVALRDRGAASTRNDADYLRSLGVRLTLAEDPFDQLGRLHELSIKTNQFNTALARFSEAEVAQRLVAPDCRVVSVALADRLSDSGVIAAIQTRRDGPVLLVDEIAISCRALGRGLEDAIIAAALLHAAQELGVSRVRLVVIDGPRNEPARTWVEGLSENLLADGSLPLEILESRLRRVSEVISIGWTGDMA
jgi:FkbH-like protein